MPQSRQVLVLSLRSEPWNLRQDDSERQAANSMDLRSETDLWSKSQISPRGTVSSKANHLRGESLSILLLFTADRDGGLEMLVFYFLVVLSKHGHDVLPRYTYKLGAVVPCRPHHHIEVRHT